VGRFCGVGSNSAQMVEDKRVQKHSNIVLLACLTKYIGNAHVLIDTLSLNFVVCATPQGTRSCNWSTLPNIFKQHSNNTFLANTLA
jgi:hypothetical protein